VSVPVIRCYSPDGAPPPQGKFLQLILRGQEYLLFSSAELHRFHNQILGRFLEEQQLPHSWSNTQTLRIETPELTVIGGGRFRVDRERRVLELWDNSQAYGRFDERALDEKIAAAAHPWSDLAVHIA
jgi:hypothetical protein